MNKKSAMEEIKKMKSCLASLEAIFGGEVSEPEMEPEMEEADLEMESEQPKAGKKAALAAMLKKKAY